MVLVDFRAAGLHWTPTGGARKIYRQTSYGGLRVAASGLGTLALVLLVGPWLGGCKRHQDP